MNFDKSQVAKHFSKAAASYDDYAQLQRDIGTQLLAKLPQKTYQRSLDLGCGTGYFSSTLAKHSEQCLVADISSQMLETALGKVENSLLTAGLCADAEALPIADDQLDLVFSSLALQWCNTLSDALSEIKRTLRPNGLCLFSTLADGTLAELRQAWQTLDPFYEHVNRFLPMSEIQAAIACSGLRILKLEQKYEHLVYPNLLPLLQELKGIGANYVVGANKGLSSRRQLVALEQAYRQQADNQQLVATYHVIYGVLIND